MEVLNPLARDYKSIGTMKKELAELQDDLQQAHRQVCLLLVNIIVFNLNESEKFSYFHNILNDLSEKPFIS